MKITNPQEKQTAIQRIQAISRELVNFGTEYAKLDEDLRQNQEERKSKLEAIENQKKAISAQYDEKIKTLQTMLKSAKDAQKDKRKPLEKELNDIKTELGEYELQAALK
jgi:hypothetical protein